MARPISIEFNKEADRVKKRIVTLLLIVAMAFSTAVGAKTPEDAAGHWAQPVIEKWMDYGVIHGYEDGSVRPDNGVTIAEVCAIVSRMLGIKEGDVVSDSAISSEQWYFGAVAAAERDGWLAAEGSDIKAEHPATRGRTAAMLVRAFGLDSEEGEPFFDTVESSFVREIAILRARNGVKGYPDGTFRPQDGITRAELLTMLNALVQEVHFGYQDIENREISGSLMLTKPNVSLRNVQVEGDLFLTAGIDGGEVRLENATVGGTVYYAGGAENVLILKECTLERISASGQGARIIAFQNAAVRRIDCYGTLAMEEIMNRGDGFGEVYQNMPGALSVEGRVKSLTICETSEVSITETGVVNQLLVQRGADGTKIISSGKLSKVVNEAAGIKVNDLSKGPGSFGPVLAAVPADGMPIFSVSAGSTRPAGAPGSITSGFKGEASDGVALQRMDIAELNDRNVKSYQVSGDSFTHTIVMRNGLSSLTITPEANMKQAECRINGKVIEPGGAYQITEIAEGITQTKIEIYVGISKKATYILETQRLAAPDAGAMMRMNNSDQPLTLDDFSAIFVDGAVASQLRSYRAEISAEIADKGRDLYDYEIQEIINRANAVVAELNVLKVKNTEAYPDRTVGGKTVEWELTTQPFDVSVTQYEGFVDRNLSYVDVYVSSVHPDSPIRINGEAAKSGETKRISGLSAGDNQIDIVVTSLDGQNSKTYVIHLDKDADDSVIANSSFRYGSDSTKVDGWSIGKSSPANGVLDTESNPGWLRVKRTNPGTSMWQFGLKSATFSMPKGTDVTIEFMAMAVGGKMGESNRTINVMRKVGTGSELSAVPGNGSGNVPLVNGQRVSYTFNTGGSVSDGMTDGYIYLQTGNSKGQDEPDVLFRYIRVSYRGEDGMQKSIFLAGEDVNE